MRWPLKRSTLILWLYQRHALKAFRASVGDVEGHFNFAVTTVPRFLASTRGPVFEPPLLELASFFAQKHLDFELILHEVFLGSGKRIS